MQSITLTAVVDENGHLEMDVPLPPGPVEVVIRPVADNGEVKKPQPITREWARAKLVAAGLVNPNTKYAPPAAKPLERVMNFDPHLPALSPSGRRGASRYCAFKPLSMRERDLG